MTALDRRPDVGVSRLYLGLCGRLSLPRYVHDLWDRPRLVTVTADPAGAVRFAPAGHHGRGTYRVRRGDRSVCLQGVVGQRGWQAAVGRHHPYRLVGGALVVTLNLTP